MARKRSEPNLFELQGGGVTITWTPAGFTGRPQLTYDDGDQQQTFGPDAVVVSGKSPLGKLVTAELSAVPDEGTTSLVLVVPQVNMGDKTEQRVRTLAVVTTVRTSIGGPALVTGQLQTYKTVRLSGTAKQVEF